MAIMLIRTSRVFKYRVAVYIRVIFFISIPLLYLVFNNSKPVDDKDIDSGKVVMNLLLIIIIHFNHS